MTATVISDAEYRLPGWASDIRRLASGVIEYWKPINLLACTDGDQRVLIELVQRGPEAPIQLQVGEIRYSLREATDLLHDVLWGMRIMQDTVLEHYISRPTS